MAEPPRSRVRAGLLCLCAMAAPAAAQTGGRPATDLPALPPPAERPAPAIEPRGIIPPPPTPLLAGEIRPIDLGTALRLAGAQNPELFVARQRVLEAEAVRQLAAAQILPTINAGMNYDAHGGNLQQSNGNILSVNRSAVYVGAGANAIAAGTVNIPGVVLSGNIGSAVFAFLASRQLVQQREAATIAVRNQVFLAVTRGYCELLRAEGRHALSLQIRDEARTIADLTANYAATGQGRQADADRAATELARREAEVRTFEGEIVASSARLCEVLNLDPTLRLHPTDAWVVPQPIVPSPMPLHELVAVALLNRPELAERRAAIREAILLLDSAKLLPFSPNVLLGYSAGGFGGGSNLVRPVFGGFGGRYDLDVVAYWTIQNLGVGNAALIRLANAQLQARRYQELAVLNRVRAEVAEAYARMHARYAQIDTNQSAVEAGARALREDYERIQARAERDVLPIELLDSFRLKARARYEYLDSIVDYNEAQFALYVALGQPPADTLARPVPTEGVEPLPMRGGTPAENAPEGAAPARTPLRPVAATEPLPPAPARSTRATSRPLAVPGMP
jgi:outer membrane protein TolC